MFSFLRIVSGKEIKSTEKGMRNAFLCFFDGINFDSR